ncbi:heavy-metal-associated domain-containing protein [Mucilaginibacter pallidiroseus]|uniref:Heavy-metal-associated domain-containing protein n=1 Tax=Mucilaginibacter pallidiroseus TaxID=2599295 RepID=A0A563UI71_9SPHI|nr:heavy metal-associated domain-containing protein [Mucilaginibacter pallidiroseus]TWR31084.1 heavy-metal-associated domain-containing protein [Mucilaginibacter pallidiroseus]
MTHTYNITGMTCTGCQAKVHSLLSKIPHITNVDIDLANGKADVSMDQHVATDDLKAALAPYPKYSLSEASHQYIPASADLTADEPTRGFIETYKPVLLVFGYIAVVSALISASGTSFNWMLAMRSFMGGFFLVFSFFKLLNLDAFADSYSSYDVIAKKFRAWGFIYAFIELALGIAFVVNFNPFATNLVTLVVMGISIIGVLQSVLNKRKIQCACLGTVFNLPMSTLTIIEDALMIAMSIVMLIMIG